MLDLRALANARYPELALTIYLPAGPALDERFYIAQFKDLAKELESNMGKREKAALEREAAQVRSFLEEETIPGRAVAIFSSTPADLFEASWLPDDVTAAIWLDARLHLEQIVDQAQRHPAAIIVLVDQEEARLFQAFLGQVEEIAELKGSAISRHKRGDWSDDKHQRREDLHAKLNFRGVIDWLARRDPNGKLPLYLAGPADDRATFRRDLPKPLQHAVRKEFAAPMYLTAGELSERLKVLA